MACPAAGPHLLAGPSWGCVTSCLNNDRTELHQVSAVDHISSLFGVCLIHTEIKACVLRA